MKSETKLIEDCIQLLLKNNSNDWFEGYIQANRNRYIRDFNMIANHLEEGKQVIGDLGAAPFLTSLALVKSGHMVDSFDIDPDRFMHLTDQGINLRKINLDDWKNSDHGKYDLLILTEVFEHLRGNLIDLMTNMHVALKPGGQVYLTTPNFRSVTGFFKLIFKKVSYANAKDLHFEWNKINTIGHMGHVREYTFHELKVFFRQIGFELNYAKTYPAKLGTGLKNQILYTTEKVFNPLNLGSGSIFFLQKNE